MGVDLSSNNRIYILAFVGLGVLGAFMLNNSVEGFGNISAEALENIASISGEDDLKVTNLHVTGKLIVDGIASARYIVAPAGIQSGGIVMGNNKIVVPKNGSIRVGDDENGDMGTKISNGNVKVYRNDSETSVHPAAIYAKSKTISSVVRADAVITPKIGFRAGGELSTYKEGTETWGLFKNGANQRYVNMNTSGTL